MKRICIVFICFFILASGSYAFNLRKSAPDIKGSIINSIFQDARGLIWIGTNTGISRYDGKSSVQITGFNGVSNIVGIVNAQIIVETLYGLKLYNYQNDSVSNFEMFRNTAFLTSDNKGTIFTVQGNGSVYYKTVSQNEFDNIIVPDLFSNNISFFKAENNILRIISADGVLRNFEIVYNNDAVYLNEKSSIKVGLNILFCFESENRIFLIDNNYIISELNVTTNKPVFIADVKHTLGKKGKITAGVVFKDDFYFGTETGLYAIKNNNAVRISLKNGITYLFKDKYQDLIWIGTSGDGLYTLSYDPHTIKSNLLSDFSPSVSKPITAICLNDDRTLWLGTEGNGIITVPNYNSDNEISETYLISVNNGLPDNTVYSLQKSENGIWIGCKSGLAFYSNKHKSISIINTSLKNIYAICEQGSVLWIACYGKGIVKATLTFKGELPELINTPSYSINNGDKASNRFTSIYTIKNNIVFINKGFGVFELAGNELKRFSEKLNLVNDIATIDDNTFIASTDFGAIKLSGDQKFQLNDIATKDIIRGIWNDYWLSTDNGLILYNAKLDVFRYFDNRYGLTVTEYCNSSAFKDEQNGTLFFGGINGFTTVRYNYYDEAMDYIPPLFLEKLTVFGIDKNVKDIEQINKLVFNSDENFFSVTFNALDYINGNNYTYYYKIGDGQWVDNGNSGSVSFTDVGVGNYDLYIKYYNKMLNKESYSKKLTIIVLPPWYQSAYAYGIYLLTFLLGVYLTAMSLLKRRRKLKEEEAIKAEQHRKEEIYEAKLDFFTDIAHEFCTPLTLIYGPCNRILRQKNVNPSVLKYVNVINRNAKRMNSLISDLMDFKQIESGHKQPEIKRLNVSEIADSVIDVFKVNTSGASINIKKQYYSGLYWNSDEKFLVTIFSNLISNAVKYSKGDRVKVEISTENNILIIKVSNGGRGISKEDIANIFNRYTVLNNLETSAEWRQNGLGLPLTAGMVKLLNGNINVESIPDEITTFTVCLLEISECETQKTQDIQIDRTVITDIMPTTRYIYKEDRQTVTVIDDDLEMLWLICDVLNDEFNVIPVKDPSSVLEVLSVNKTDIILCDLMMIEVNGIELAKTIKSDKSISHIPFIIISAVHESEKQTEAINAGAEVYITKPFNPDYLKSIIKRLLGRKEDLKDYFASPLSAYELNMGKLQHTEHRKFLKKVYGIINKNIQDENLSPDFIATELGMSTRSLYRKLKEVTDRGLLKMIREGRLTVAENLLIKSKYTIAEIVFKSGFSNRASFYRAFSKKYGCTPTEFITKNSI